MLTSESRWGKANKTNERKSSPPATPPPVADPPPSVVPTTPAPPTVVAPAGGFVVAPHRRNGRAKVKERDNRNRTSRMLSIEISVEKRLVRFVIEQNISITGWLNALIDADLKARGY